MKKYIMAFDAGTTSSRTIIFDKNGEIVSSAQKEFTQYFPKPGYVEHDANEIWSTQLGTAIEAMYKAGISADEIASIGITNQRETTVLWNKKTGEPIYNAIVWQCRRTSSYCDELKANGYEDMIKEKTGLIIDAYFSATKIKWILDNVKGARKLAEDGDLMFGTIDSYLIYRLTDKKVHVTDYSNASRTMIFNINTLKWDDDILELLNIPKNILPEVKNSMEIYGYTNEKIFGQEIPIAAAIGDQQSALFGQLCIDEAEAKNTYGTGAFLLMNTGDKIVNSKNGLLSTIAWSIDGKVNYALEGSIFVAGSSIQWLRDKLRLIDSSEDSEYMARKVDDTLDCYVVPAFTGLGAPYWNQYARGTVVGITRGTTKYHLIRATLESIAYLSYDVLHAMEEDLGHGLKLLKVDGGASNNNFLMQFQSDILGCEVKRPKVTETTALGACYLAGLAVGFWKDIDDLKNKTESSATFTPNMEEDLRKKKIKRWHKAVETSFDWGLESE